MRQHSVRILVWGLTFFAIIGWENRRQVQLAAVLPSRHRRYLTERTFIPTLLDFSNKFSGGRIRSGEGHLP